MNTTSHPVWVRGLKQDRDNVPLCFKQVAPRVGAWIETIFGKRDKGVYRVAPRVGAWIETFEVKDVEFETKSHPVWVRGLKHQCANRKGESHKSHPVWVRGLKLCVARTARFGTWSHPVWVRGLKHTSIFYVKNLNASRTPCGCVD